MHRSRAELCSLLVALGGSPAGLGTILSRLETLSARLVLFWAVAALAFGAAFFDLLKVPTKVRRRSVALFSLAVTFGVAPYLIRYFLM
jgi:membrane protein implicated in regulation of membrane protease activity